MSKEDQKEVSSPHPQASSPSDVTQPAALPEAKQAWFTQEDLISVLRARAPESLAITLHAAVQADQVDAVEILLQSGANVNSRDEHDQTPLRKAAEIGNSKVIQKLLDSKADVNARDKFGQSPLYIAMMQHDSSIFANVDRSEAVRLLLEGKADVNVQGNNRLEGKSVLHDAVATGSAKIVRMILEHRADVRARNRNGKDALGYVVDKLPLMREIIPILLQYKDKTHAADIAAQQAAQSAFVEEMKAKAAASIAPAVSEPPASSSSLSSGPSPSPSALAAKEWGKRGAEHLVSGSELGAGPAKKRGKSAEGGESGPDVGYQAAFGPSAGPG